MRDLHLGHPSEPREMPFGVAPGHVRHADHPVGSRRHGPHPFFEAFYSAGPLEIGQIERDRVVHQHQRPPTRTANRGKDRVRQVAVADIDPGETVGQMRRQQRAQPVGLWRQAKTEPSKIGIRRLHLRPRPQPAQCPEIRPTPGHQAPKPRVKRREPVPVDEDEAGRDPHQPEQRPRIVQQVGEIGGLDPVDPRPCPPSRARHQPREVESVWTGDPGRSSVSIARLFAPKPSLRDRR
ncbi:MAG: hypothetical protein R3D59_03420 [Paracoccaceae bacterium]